MAVVLTRRRFTADEYRRMVDAGILTADDRVELIDGEIVEMSPMGPPHTMCQILLTCRLLAQIGDRALALVQGPLPVGPRHEFQPDILQLRPKPGGYWRRIPYPEDVLLAIEVSDTTLARDRAKLARYAEAGVPEVWIVNLEDAVVELYRNPAADGYRNVLRVGRGGQVSPAAFRDVVLPVDDLVGEPQDRDVPSCS